MSGQKPDPTGAKILDGATRVLGDFGFKRATVELVAKYAGVSHMTIYRRWPSKNDLLKTAIMGEFTTLLETAFASTGSPGTSFADRSVNAFADIVWTLQSHPLVLRELNSESGEQLPASTSGAVMEACVPLVTEQLQSLGAAAEDAPADLDPVADVFVRLAYSLVTVKRPGRPLTTRPEVEDYARECFGPYMEGLAADAAQPAEAPVIDMEAYRPPRSRRNRPGLQIAAASILSALTIGAGLTAVLSGNVRLPFVAPANFSTPEKQTTSTTSPDGRIVLPAGPAQGGPGGNSGAQLPDSPAQPPAAIEAPSAVSPPVALPASPPAGPRSAPDIGSVAGNPLTGDRPAPENPVPALAPPPGPTPPGPGPGPQPPAPGPQPPAPGPQPPPPGPKPPAPSPKPPAPGPQPPPPAPKPPGPGPGPGPGPKPPGPGPQQQQGPGPGQPGPGNQQNRPPAPSN